MQLQHSVLQQVLHEHEIFFWQASWGEGLRHQKCMGRIICMSLSSHLPRVRTLRTSAYRLFPDECRASDFPILEQR